MANNPSLQQRAGRNIGIESLPPFIHSAGAPEVEVTPGSGAVGQPATLLEAVESGLRTPFTRAATNGYIFNHQAEEVFVGVFFEDGLGNSMLIGFQSVPASGAAAIDLSGAAPGENPFTPLKPLCLCDDEKLVARAATAPVP